MLEEKLDLLTKEVVALRKAVELNTAAGGATASKGKPAADDDGEEEAPVKKTRAKAADKKAESKKKAVEPEHDKDDVEAIIRKVSKEVGKPVAKKIISSFECDDLAELLTHPEHFDAAYEKAEAALNDDGEDEDEI